MREGHPTRRPQLQPSAQGQEQAFFGFPPRAEDAPTPRIYRQIVDAGLTPAHQAVLVELPQLVTIAAPPLARFVVALVLESDSNTISAETPQLLAERVVQFAQPLTAQELNNLFAAGHEFIAVAPHRVLGVSKRDPLRGAGIPSGLGGLYFLARRLLGERRKWRRAVP